MILLSTAAGRSEDDKSILWNVIHQMENIGVERILPTLTTRWFTDEFIKTNPQIVETRLQQVVNTDTDIFMNVFRIYAGTEMLPWLHELTQTCSNHYRTKKTVAAVLD